ncbi:hypothetical protein [Vulgatibacter incomptus]|uniref:Uncharacterized protein n=1 Tax=Vulgatibacter incomptus TaxID=1391653 RepID=A0A0K1PAA1_9BACT|nr:hypothetical protein [Vulgatibacter incomptus]AKU90044.1 hypothetical protein AKJ08_0431 [Vulgatibacter incomptus]
MWGLVKFAFLVLVAIAVGLAAVSLPIEGKTAAEHVRALLGQGSSESPKADRQKAPPARASAAPIPASANRPPAEAPSDDDRKALDRLIGDRIR